MEGAISVQEAINQQTGNVKLHGWAYRERKSKEIVFIVLRDATNILQCVAKKSNLTEDEWKQAETILIESSLELEGEIRPDKRAPTGYEVEIKKLSVIGRADNFPINKDQSQEFLLDNRHLWLRSRKLTSVMKIRSTVFKAIHEFFQSKGYFEAHAPIFTPSACEGGATLFEVKYFNEKAYLTQSWQLYAEAMIASLEKIYTIAPCFRAERSKTSRHLAEFWMAEMEVAWLKLEDVMDVSEELIEYIVQSVLKENEEELKLLERDVEKLKKIKRPFNRMTYKEAVETLQKGGIEIEFGKDLRTIEEDKLMEKFDKPLLVSKYPKEIMAFYKPSDPNDKSISLNFDMLAPEGYGEIVGGSEREMNIDNMKNKLIQDGEKVENYEWYFDTRRYGNIPHSGFGMGVERIIAWVCGLDNIKDAIAFPRTMTRNKP